MSRADKVLWAEGIFLKPQHFQQQERYLSNQLQLRIKGLRSYDWGINHLKIDDASLLLGKFALLECSGVFPDGQAFSFPDTSPPPLPLSPDIDAENETIYLCIPDTESSGTTEVSYSDMPDESMRYRANHESITDSITKDSNEQELIQTASLSLFLKTGRSDLGGFNVIPVAKILNVTKEGKVVLDEKFIPTTVQAAASSRLATLCKEVHGLIQQRARDLAARIGSPDGSSVSDVADFLLLMICNRYDPLLKHLSETHAIHPESLYQIYVQLLGELSTICTSERRPEIAPLYNHIDLESSFTPLVSRLRELLNWIPKTKSDSIAIKDHGYGIRSATVHDAPLLKNAQFVLAVSASVQPEKIRSTLPGQTTVATVDRLKDFVTSHTPGVELVPMNVAPRQIPYHEGFVYFSFNRSNRLWADIANSGTIAMHFSGELPGMELQLWAIRSEQ